MSYPKPLVEKLYDQALLQPAIEGADRLCVVSGYATPAMASRFLNKVGNDVNPEIGVELVVGMVGKEGISLQDHDGFVALEMQPPAGNLTVAYTTNGRSVHTKLYVWIKAGVPVKAFAGSANFTQNGFLVGRGARHHSELLVEIDPVEGLSEFRRIEAESLRASHPDVKEEVNVKVSQAPPKWSVAASDEVEIPLELVGVEAVVLPLVALTNSGKGTKRGHPQLQWGLNWGQRPERKNKNEAVLSVPRKVWATSPDFFPRGTAGDRPQFLVSTDDDKSLFMVVAEQGDKALHSLPSNAFIGEYFRHRLGVASGSPIELEDLVRNGSRFVKMYRTEEESYHLEYSVDAEAEGAEFYEL